MTIKKKDIAIKKKRFNYQKKEYMQQFPNLII